MTIKQSISKGEVVNVGAVVQNIGENSGTKTVELIVNGTTVDSSSVSLNSDEQTVVSLTWDTTGYVPDIYDIELNTGGSASVRNIIIDGSWLDVSNLTTNGPVTEGETLTASADVTNIGRETVTDVISFRVNSNTLDSTNVTLDVEERKNLTFSWDTSSGEAGDHTVEIASIDDSESEIVTVEADSSGITISQQKDEIEALVQREYDSKGVNTLSATVSNSNVEEVELEVSRNGGAYERVQEFDETSLQNIDIGNPDGTIESNIPGGIREGYNIIWDDPQQSRLLLIYGDTSTPREMKWAESPTGDPTNFENYQTVFTNPSGGNMESPTVFWDGSTLHGYYESDSSNILVDHMTTNTRTGDTGWTVQSTLPTSFASIESWRYEGESFISGEYWEENPDENNLVMFSGPKHGQLNQNKIVALSNNFGWDRHLAIKSIFHDSNGNMYGYANVLWPDGNYDNIPFWSKTRDNDNFPIDWQSGNRMATNGKALHGLLDLFNEKVLYGHSTDFSDLFYWNLPSSTKSKTIGTTVETVSFDYYEPALAPGDTLSWRVIGVKADDTEVVSDEKTFNIVSQTDFQASIESTSSPVKPGETLNADCRVTNTGLESGSQTVLLNIDNGVGQVDSTSFTLSAGESDQKTLSWDVPNSQNEQDYTATLETDDNISSKTISVSSTAGLPSSSINRWKLDDLATGTATDSIGSADGTVKDISSVSGNYQGGSAGQGDGENYIATTTLPNLQDASLSGFTVAFVIESTTNDSRMFTIAANSDSATEELFVEHNYTRPNRTGQNNTVLVAMRSDGNGFVAEAVDSQIYDGNKHSLVLGISPTNSLAQIYLDGNAISTTITVDESPTQDVQISRDFSLFALNNGTPDLLPFNGILDDIVLANDMWDSNDAQQYHNDQPWS